MFHKLVDTADDRTVAMIRVILGLCFSLTARKRRWVCSVAQALAAP